MSRKWFVGGETSRSRPTPEEHRARPRKKRLDKIQIVWTPPGQLSQGGQHGLDGPRTGDSHLFARRLVLIAARRFVTRDGCRVDCRAGVRRRGDVVVIHRQWDASLIDGFTEGVIRNVEFASDFRFGPAFLEPLLSLFDDFRGHHRSLTSSTRFVKPVDAFLAILVDTPQNTALGDSKGFDDLCLFAGTLDAELYGEHAKRSQITFRMVEHGLRTAEIEPLPIPPHDAGQITDASSILRNQQQ